MEAKLKLTEDREGAQAEMVRTLIDTARAQSQGALPPPPTDPRPDPRPDPRSDPRSDPRRSGGGFR